MNLPENTHLAYIVWHEAWYHDATHIPGEHPHLMVSASAGGGGCAWEFQIDGYELGGHEVTRVKMFDDAYAALAQMPEFFAALAERQPGTLKQVRAFLDALGAKDETPRVSPYPDRPAKGDPLDEIAKVLRSPDGAIDRLTQIDAIVRSTGRGRQD